MCSQDQYRSTKSVSQVLEGFRESLEEVTKAHKISIGARSPFLRFDLFFFCVLLYTFRDHEVKLRNTKRLNI